MNEFDYSIDLHQTSNKYMMAYRSEVLDESRLLDDDGAVLLRGDDGHLLHELAPLGLGRHRRVHAVLQRGGREPLQRLEAQVLLPEHELDDLALHRHTDGPVDGVRRLGQDGEVRRATAPADGATAAVEQGQLHAVLLGHLGHLLLRHVQLPRRGQAAGVLAGVGVADHHLLLAVDVVDVPVSGEELLHGRRRRLQVGQPLEQRHHGERLANATLALQELDGEHVRGRRAHGDDVGAEAVDRELGQDAHGADDVGDLLGHGKVRGQQWALAFQLRHQPLHPLVLGPRAVRPDAEVRGDGVDHVGVPLRLLPDVQLHQGETEREHLAKEVQEAPVGDGLVAALTQGFVAQLKGLKELHA